MSVPLWLPLKDFLLILLTTVTGVFCPAPVSSPRPWNHCYLCSSLYGLHIGNSVMPFIPSSYAQGDAVALWTFELSFMNLHAGAIGSIRGQAVWKSDSLLWIFTTVRLLLRKQRKPTADNIMNNQHKAGLITTS